MTKENEPTETSESDTQGETNSNNEAKGISVLSYAKGGLIKAVRMPDGNIYY